ncbi:MAG: ABC transporter substrate-binding protein [Bacteroidetes bacterium]|nr:ABC transporter substrate-binding protein [Bacteroidota bacterium]
MRAKVCLAIALMTVAIVLSLVAACAPAAPTAAPAKPTAAAAAPATAAAPPTAPTSPPAAAPTPVPKIKRGGSVRTAILNTYDTLDPKLSSLGTSSMWAMMFDSLVRLDLVDPAGKFEPKPELAESWSLPDPKTLVLKLRKGVKFHDGTDFNAEAAKWNIDRMMSHPKSTSKLMVEEIASADAVDPQTLRLNLKQPSAVILHKLTMSWGGTGSAGPGMMSKAAAEKLGDEIGNRPAGTGPMQLDQWLRDDRVILKRFDGYWKMGVDGQPLPYVDKFEERWMGDPAVSLLEMKAGNLELLEAVEGKDIAGVKANPNLVYWELPWGGPYFFAASLNPTKGPFANNLKLRQAALYAIDRDAMAKVLGFGDGIPLYYMYWTKGQLGYDESLPRYNYDLQKAKGLVAEAGYPNGLDITLDFITRAEDQRIAQVVKDMWDKAGIRTTLSGMERLAWVDKTRKACNFDANFGRMSGTPDPDGHSRLIITNGSANYGCTNLPDLDQCMSDGRTTYDPAKRQEIYKRCITILYENAYQTTGYTRPANFVHPAYLKGARPQWAIADLKEVWLDK